MKITNTEALEDRQAPAIERWLARFDSVRARSNALAAGLEPEDTVIQSMTEASPIGWQLAHTAWFFEEFVLRRLDPAYVPVDEAYRFLFNSYYEAIGERTPRDARGLMSRPTWSGIRAYRAEIEARVHAALSSPAFAALADAERAAVLEIIELGCFHEEQHQELMVTDLKHAFSFNPLQPAMGDARGILLGLDDAPLSAGVLGSAAPAWLAFEGGTREIGAAPDAGFAFDNERPRHTVYVQAFAIAATPVTARAFAAFVDAGGYTNARYWLSVAWERLRGVPADERVPLYWRREANGAWSEYTTRGRVPLALDAPARHISYEEADAFARWSGARLPTEAEWEVASDQLQGVGHVWEWTSSAYSAYPGYRTAEGALGEYNGKFMSGQFVLRGASCATPPGHSRPTYRNFFPPESRWQFSGLRLAHDVS